MSGLSQLRQRLSCLDRGHSTATALSNTRALHEHPQWLKTGKRFKIGDDFTVNIIVKRVFWAEENIITLLFYYSTFKMCFCFRLKSKSSPVLPRSPSLNLLCVLSAPHYSLATLRVPPRLTCLCLCVTLVLRHKTTRRATRNVA